MLNKLKKSEGKNLKSGYRPKKAEGDMLAFIMGKFEKSQYLREQTYEEFNNWSLLNRQQKDQRAFNIWQENREDGGEDAWKSNAVRPIERNRIISIAAHVAQSLIFPKVTAQNTEDEEDRDAATVMQELMEWRADQADYEKTFLYSVIAACVNPAVIVHTEFAEVKRKIKEIISAGKWKEKEVLDEVFSGFQDSIVPVEELYIANFYEEDIQKQEYLIWRKVIDYGTAAAKYGAKPNFQYVKPGQQHVMVGSEMYYEDDETLRGDLVEEVVFYHRGLDLQVTVLSGTMMDDPEQPNPRKDKKYPFAKTGYEILSSEFFYYKSLANKMSVDGDVVNTLYRMVIDGTFLQLMPPTAIFGEEEVNSNILMPGVVTNFGKDTKLEKIDLGNNLTAGLNVLGKVESSISESSQDPISAGIPVKGEQTKAEIQTLQQNSATMLGMFTKMVGFLVKDLGQLFISDILQFVSVGEMNELSTGDQVLKFRKVLIPDKLNDGMETTHVIDFDMSLPNDTSDAQEKDMSMDIFTQEGGLDAVQRIYKVNPKLFREMKYKTRVTPEVLMTRNDNVTKALNLELYDRAISNPHANQQSIYKDLLLGSYDTTKGQADKFMKESAGAELTELLGDTSQTPMSRQSPVQNVMAAEAN